jgi:hypothetical protein
MKNLVFMIDLRCPVTAHCTISISLHKTLLKTPKKKGKVVKTRSRVKKTDFI